MGYTGGTKPNPTYDSVCRGDGHTEALKIQFDPSVISYEEVMKKVIPNTSSFKAKRQYMSAVWAQNEEQEKVAKAVAKSLGKEDVPILPAQHWQDAEEYHRRACPICLRTIAKDFGPPLSLPRYMYMWVRLLPCSLVACTEHYIDKQRGGGRGGVACGRPK